MDRIGSINANELYTLTEFKRRLRLSTAAWWALRDKGAPHIPSGKQLLIYGGDFIEWMRAFTRRKEPQGDDRGGGQVE